MGKQMTASAGAPINDVKWAKINWDHARSEVRRLQMHIAKATMQSNWGKVKSLQHLLSSSFYAKLLAVKRVTSNKGKKTPGIDGVLWKGARAKMQAVLSLRRRGYQPLSLRRIYIPKKNGKMRPLSIPCILDRAMQALYKLALSPVAETVADRNSYGFRECRSCADAIAAAFNALSKPNSTTWVLEADIAGCYDNISQEWMLKYIPMDPVVLRKWLQAGYIENDKLYPSRKRTPQGGIISPTLANLTLDGLVRVVRNAVPHRSRVNFVRYADDFIITGKSKHLLEMTVKPVVEKFLEDRGLSLSPEKTKITHIKNGFTFLGQHFRKNGRTLHITPAKEGVLSPKSKVGELIRKHVGSPLAGLVMRGETRSPELNQTLRGWGNYRRHVVSSEAFSQIDTYVFEQLWRMIRRRHRKKSKKWLTHNYWSFTKRRWMFTVKGKTKKGPCVYQVIRLSSLGIKRYTKIKADANPYYPKYAAYIWLRKTHKIPRHLPALSARGHRALKAN